MLASRDETNTHQAVAKQLTAVIQRRNNNKSYQEKRFDSAKNKQYQLERVQAAALIAGTLPLSWLLKSHLSISQSTHCCFQHMHEHEQRDSTNETIVIVTDNCRSVVNCPIGDGIVPVSWLLLRFLSISQSAHCCYQHTNTNRETVQL